MEFMQEKMSKPKQKISPFLWFDGQAEEAVNFYISIFEDSRVKAVTHYSGVGPGIKGTVMTIAFELAGQEFVALNGGPQFQFTEAISFAVNCQTQQEVDELWEKLSEGGKERECGWLKDKYGLSWQIWPVALLEMLRDSDPARSQRVMKAVMQMKKLDITVLERAFQKQE